MADLKSKAKAAFDYTKSIDGVYVTSDGEVFAKKTDAKLHAKESKLEDKTITSFTRDQANDQVSLEDEKTLIGKIEAAKTSGDVYQLVRGWTDTRETVAAAARERIDEIEKAEGK